MVAVCDGTTKNAIFRISVEHEILTPL